jgi:hypothetical protein
VTAAKHMATARTYRTRGAVVPDERGHRGHQVDLAVITRVRQTQEGEQ